MINRVNRGSEKSYSKAPIFMPKEDTSDEYDDDEIDEDTSDEYDGDKIDKDNFENSSKDSKQIDFKTSKKENSEIFVFSIWNDKEINEIIKNCARTGYEKFVTIGDSIERLIYDGTNEKVYKELIFKIIDKFTKNICKKITYNKTDNEIFGILDYIEIHRENICKNLTNKTVMIIRNIICEKISAKYGHGMVAECRKQIVRNTINKITNKISNNIYEKLNDHIYRVIDERIFYEVIGQQSK